MVPQSDPYSAIASEDVLAAEPDCIRSALAFGDECMPCTTSVVTLVGQHTPALEVAVTPLQLVIN